MSTFQSIVYAIIHGFTEFLPISRSAHDHFVPYVLGRFFHWSEPTLELTAAFYIGSLLALFVYFRHDWASMISSLLQVILFRRKPMTLDERMPFFILISTLPVIGAAYYFKESLETFHVQPLWLAASLTFFTVSFWISDAMNRKNRKIVDWNWLDALIVGFCQLTALVPGAGRQVGAFTGAMARHYSLEAAAKYVFFSQLPLIIFGLVQRLQIVDFHGATAGPGLSWLSFVIATIVTFFCGLLAIGGFMKSVLRGSLRHYMLYRLVLAFALVVAYLTIG